MSEILRLGVVIPVFNDWQSASKLVLELAKDLRTENPSMGIHFVIVDDGSTEKMPLNFETRSDNFSLEVVGLSANQGHQKAIVAGLRHVQNQDVSHVLVMDSDGEDTPRGAVALIRSGHANMGSIVVAQRGLRAEKISFRVLYRAYKVLFYWLVGVRLDFGNFSLIPVGAVGKLLAFSDSASHLPSTILRSGLHIKRVRVDRGARYFGKSKMNLERLVSHSFASFAVFSDRIMVRLMIFSFLTTAITGIGIIAVVINRVLVDSVTPGWATAAVGLLAVICIQVLGFVGLGTLITLNLNSLKNFYLNQQAPSDSQKPERP